MNVTAVVAHRIMELSTDVPAPGTAVEAARRRLRMAVFDHNQTVAFLVGLIHVSIVPQPNAYEVDVEESEGRTLLKLVGAVQLSDDETKKLKLPRGTWGI